jgi:hypothetical protein
MNESKPAPPLSPSNSPYLISNLLCSWPIPSSKSLWKPTPRMKTSFSSIFRAPFPSCLPWVCRLLPLSLGVSQYGLSHAAFVFVLLGVHQSHLPLAPPPPTSHIPPNRVIRRPDLVKWSTVHCIACWCLKGVCAVKWVDVKGSLQICVSQCTVERTTRNRRYQ